MNLTRPLSIITIFCLITYQTATARSSMDSSGHHNSGWYWGNSFEGAMFSTANINRPTGGSTMGTLRFSYFINAGVTFNHDISETFGIFTGLSIKNVGFIEKTEGDSTIKRRTYNLCVPIGIKIGNIAKKSYFFGGVDLEIPFNYKEKGFKSRNEKTKLNSWFSSRTPAFMPAVYAGFCIKPGITFKLEYYLSNFLNTGFTDKGVQPYAGYDVHLMMLSIGTDLHYNYHKHGTTYLFD